MLIVFVDLFDLRFELFEYGLIYFFLFVYHFELFYFIVESLYYGFIYIFIYFVFVSEAMNSFKLPRSGVSNVVQRK